MNEINRMGETNISNEGYEMKIIKYNGCMDIWVEFQDEHSANVHAQYSSFKNGEVKNPYHKSVFGVGYLGQGKYKTMDEYNKHTMIYKTWQRMLKRCYDAYYINKYPSYIDCIVCKEWHNFQSFASWYETNYYEIPNEKMELDKDILIKGNKIYSPETCMFVPKRINILFTKCNAIRGKYPIGVCLNKNVNKFMAYCSFLNENGKKKKKTLGYYNTSEEAFLVYKQFKEKYIRQIANEYKDLIPNKLYEALYRYEVEIND